VATEYRNLYLAHPWVIQLALGAVRNAAREKRVKELTGMTDEEWWYRVAPFLETLDFTPYPVLARVGKSTGEAYGAHDEGA
jgi:hypothetical protein